MNIKQFVEQSEREFDQNWDEIFPARNGTFLKGTLPRFKSMRDAIKSHTSSKLRELLGALRKEVEWIDMHLMTSGDFRREVLRLLDEAGGGK